LDARPKFCFAPHKADLAEAEAARHATRPLLQVLILSLSRRCLAALRPPPDRAPTIPHTIVVRTLRVRTFGRRQVRTRSVRTTMRWSPLFVLRR